MEKKLVFEIDPSGQLPTVVRWGGVEIEGLMHTIFSQFRGEPAMVTIMPYPTETEYGRDFLDIMNEMATAGVLIGGTNGKVRNAQRRSDLGAAKSLSSEDRDATA